MTKAEGISSKDGIKVIALLFLFFAVGVALRFIPWQNFITPERVYFLEPDNYEHFRKISVILHNFPHAPAHDYYGGFPVGMGTIWSPLLDLTFAALIKALSYAAPLFETMYLTTILPPFIGMLAIIPLFFWVRLCFGASTALLSCLLFALLPLHIDFTIIGRPDNELMEPIWAALLFYTYTRGCREYPEDGGFLTRTAATGLATGATAALALLFWRGAIIWWALLAAHAVFTILYRLLRGRSVSSAFCLFVVSTFAFTALFISTVNVVRPWGLPGGMHFNIVSWFHVITALIIMAAPTGLWLASYLREQKERSLAPSLALGAALFVLITVIIALISPQYGDEILQGVSIMGGGNKWTQTILQYWPFFSDKWGHFSITAPLDRATLLIFLTPLVLLYLSFKEKEAHQTFFIFAGWALFLLTILNGRYHTALTLIMPVCGALFLAFIYRRIAVKNIPAGLAVTLAVPVALFTPAYSFYKKLPQESPIMIKGDLEESLDWIRENTPPTSYYLTPSMKPEYGIMARWEFGGFIGAVAKRPAVATVYGIEAHGLSESAELFLSAGNDEFLRILDENRARYVIVSKTIAALPGYARVLGRAPEGYYALKTNSSGRQELQTGEKYGQLIYVNLFLADGEPSDFPRPFKGVSGLRLVHESEMQYDYGTSGKINKFKIFERVNGAVIKGRAGSGEEVILTGLVRTNQDRRFYSISTARASKDGTFTINARYPAIHASDTGVGVLGGYELRSASGIKRVFVTEKDIIEGRVIEAR